MKQLLLMAGAASLVMAGCKTTPFDGFTKAETGLYYKFLNHDENAPKAQLGDNLVLKYVISRQANDSIILNSKEGSRDGSGFLTFPLKGSSFKGSFEEGMLMMAKGDSAEFIIPADSFFVKSMGVNELPPGIKPGDFLKGTFVIKDITPAAQVEAERKKQMAEREAMMKEMEAKEKPAMEKFIADNKITAKPTNSGLYYIETKRGSGPMPKATDVVKVHYTGKFLDGKVFDSSVERGEPIEFPLNGVILGWTEGLQLMRKGGKANLLIPSAIAYGPQGNRGIPPFSPLYFEVELIDIKPGQDAMPQMPPPPSPDGK